MQAISFKQCIGVRVCVCVRELAFYFIDLCRAVIAVRLFVLFLYFYQLFFFSFAFTKRWFFFFFFLCFFERFFLLFSLFLVKACINIFVYKDITLRFAFCILHFATGATSKPKNEAYCKAQERLQQVVVGFVVVEKCAAQRVCRVSHIKKQKQYSKKLVFLKLS